MDFCGIPHSQATAGVAVLESIVSTAFPASWIMLLEFIATISPQKFENRPEWGARV
jgi:hypothetical protein